MDEHSNRNPSVSPDGLTIFFESWRNGACNIWRMATDGSGTKRITRGAYDESPCCTPDGKWVFYLSWVAGQDEICKVSPDGSEPVLWKGKLYEKPAISLDGKWLAGFVFYGSSPKSVKAL